jgi:prevent-host-death family protein
MTVINIHEAKTHLSRLVDQAAAGESFIIAKAGRPLVRVTALDAPSAAEKRRIGFLAGEIEVPEDFDTMGAETIEALFAGQPADPAGSAPSEALPLAAEPAPPLYPAHPTR